MSVEQRMEAIAKCTVLVVWIVESVEQRMEAIAKRTVLVEEHTITVT
ncbi:8249_t:CDS:2 [Funneliformis caledonium]|uniref:8249_t:CDS:1 n=1 Tax=Funneliformis caledonium TaxID=1117310 RepID=A0A9N9CYD0_9GLOM|nr:8249_t:CDS:2 [Funneliformis caledonium]